MQKTAAIIPAAGSGTRMKLEHPKQFHHLLGEPILMHTVRSFFQTPCISGIVIVVPDNWQNTTSQMLEEYGLADKTITIVKGGRRRQDSVFNGLQAVGADVEIVLVHDGARPMVSEDLINRCSLAAARHGAAIAAIPVKDTLKKGSSADTILETINRNNLWQAQTPQAAQKNLLKKAYQETGDQDVTDEASLLENAGIPVHLVEGSETNFKITRPEDLALAEKILMKTVIHQRIGHGFDAHRFVPERDLVLGGIVVPHEKGLAGHSDADVLTHALCDAILGAMGEGDLGSHFPDSDARFKNIYSISLLDDIMALADKRNLAVSNADITVICQSPKLAPHIPAMKKKLAHACKTTTDRINIKATTTEKMGYTGRQEGISCHAVVMLT